MARNVPAQREVILMLVIQGRKTSLEITTAKEKHELSSKCQEG